jgi:sodium/hydrogen antiporter
MKDAFFGLSPYHYLMLACGLVIVLGYWLPRFFSGREPAGSALLILGGVITFGLIPGVAPIFSPLERPGFWEITSEFAVIAALFGTGLRIDRVIGTGLWTPTVRLLVIAMPLCMLAVTLAGMLAGLGLAAAVLLAAVLAPTDPVLAADVQVGPPLEGGEHPVRFALTTEAGLNDGLAFPFVYLALFIASAGAAGDWIGEWFGLYLIYKIVVGVAVGAGAGWLLGKLLFSVPRKNPLAETTSGVVALAGLLLTYGACELIEGYGFIAAFVMGFFLRRAESEHEFHGRIHGFTAALEHAVTAILLVFLGGAIPSLLPYLDWQHALIAIALIFVIRPLFGFLSLFRTKYSTSQRAVVGFYGVRGLGSVYYMAYAAGTQHFAEAGVLWATVVFTIVLSTIVHGFTAGSVVWAATHEE